MRKQLVYRYALVVVLTVGSVEVVLADKLEPDNVFFQGNEGSQIYSVSEPCEADDFPDFNFDLDPFSGDTLTGETKTVIRCVVQATKGGKGMLGVQIDLTADILNEDGSVFYEGPVKTGETDARGFRGFNFPGTQGLGGAVTGVVSGDQHLTTVRATCSMSTRRPCKEDDETLCLFSDRFKVDVDWRTSNSSGPGMLKETYSDGGLYYFFNPNSPDLLVQLLRACKDNDHYWVFANAATDVEYDLTVTDTHTGTVRTYSNPLGMVAEPILDTSAFATCP